MKKRMIIIILVLLVIFGGTFGFDLIRSYMIAKYFAAYRPPPVAVSTAIAKKESWAPSLTTVGSVVAVNSVEVTSQVSGQVVAIHFKSGQMTKKNQSLVQLDDSIDQQSLRNDLAQLKYATITYQRNLQLYKQNANAKSQLDKAQAEMVSYQAAVAKDRLNIAYKNVKAPFDGRLGIRQVNVGQYVQPGTALVGLTSVSPIYIDFSLPQQDLSKLSIGQQVDANVNPYPNKTFIGKIIAINSSVTVDTRNILVRAVFKNANGLLYPGLYANVKVILPTQENVVVIPQTAVTYSLYGDIVYVVEREKVKPKAKSKASAKDKKPKGQLIAKQRFVHLGVRRGTVIAVKKGIRPGEQVVASGQIKLRNNSSIIINNSVQFKD